MVDRSPQGIIEFATVRAQQAWDEHKQPYLLARLSPDLMAEGVDYREVLGEQKLKEFLASHSEKIKVTVHPQQKAKIGLLPVDVDFQYDPAPEATVQSPPKRSMLDSGLHGSKRRYIVGSFLQMVSELDEADAKQVEIPAHILAKLLREK